MRNKPLALLVMEERRRADVYPAPVLERLGRMVEWAAPSMTRAQLLENPNIMGQVDLLFTGWEAPHLDAELLDRAPALKAVLVAAGTIRPVVSAAFWGRGIAIVSAAAANARPVADFTVAHTLLGLKQFQQVSRQIHETRATPNKSGVRGNYGATVGLVSLGQIGQMVAADLQHFGMQVQAFDPFFPAAAAAAAGISLVGLDELFATSDVVSIHTPLLEETRNLVGGGHIQSMQQGATLINTSRGEVVDEAAMVDALSDRPDIAAILDVTSVEPLDAGSRLHSLPNVVLSGHLAGAHGRECSRLGELVANEAERHARGLPLLHAVSYEQSLVRA